MLYDQRLKELLRTFFFEFLTLFFPSLANAIDPASLSAQDPEVFTDLPEGQQRMADLVMRARGLVGVPMVVLFHTEVQAQRQETFGLRVWQYNALLRLRRGLPTISVAVVLYSGTPGISVEQYAETLLGRSYPMGEYWQVGLRDLRADDYIHAGSDLAAALAALMRPGPGGRAALKIALLRRLMASTLDEARLFLLVNTVETYLVLNAREEAELWAQLRAEGDNSVEATELTWMDKLLEQGREQGIEQGTLAAKRALVSLQIRTRFGQVPDALDARLAAADNATLDRMATRIVQAPTLEEFIANV